MTTIEDPETVLRAIKGELELQMEKATFNTWLKDARLLFPPPDTPLNGRMVIGVRNEYAKDWLQNRLHDTIMRTAAGIARRPLDIEYEVWSDELPPTPSPSTKQKGTKSAIFPGFEPLDSNWTQTPDMFFTYVIPNAHAIVTKLVGAVIHQTIGQFDDKKRNHRREEWPVNNTVLQRVAGISSKTSFQTALWDARADGYIILRPLDEPEEQRKLSQKMKYKCYYTLRVRYPDDLIDYPSEERPGYGNARKPAKR